MYGPQTEQLNFKVSKELKTNLKGYAVKSNIPFKTYLNRILVEHSMRVERGDDPFLKLERKK